MNTVTHLGPCLQCSSSAKTTLIIIAGTEIVGPAYCNPPPIAPRGLLLKSSRMRVRPGPKPAINRPVLTWEFSDDIKLENGNAINLSIHLI